MSEVIVELYHTIGRLPLIRGRDLFGCGVVVGLGLCAQ